MADPLPESPPEEETKPTTGSMAVLGANGERLRSLLRLIFAGCLGACLIGDIWIYSLYQALRSQSDSQEHRIERLNKMVSDLMLANDSAKKIEKIEQQVNGIEGQVSDLTATIKAQDQKAETPAPEPEKKRKKQR